MTKVALILVVCLATFLAAYQAVNLLARRRRADLLDRVNAANPVAGNEIVEGDPAMTRIRVLDTSGGLVFSKDEGGGHLGARGLFYCSKPGCTPEQYRPEFSEGILFKKLEGNWWSYRSSEE